MTLPARRAPSLLATLWPASASWRPRRRSVRVLEDVPYREGARAPCQALDVVLPLDAPAAPRPWVLFAHGGLWKGHERRLLRALSGLYTNVGAALAGAGLGGVIAGYRQRGASALDGLEDLAAAWREVVRRAPEWGLDPERGVIMGHSGGAHLAVLLALGGEDGVHPRGAVALAGFYDAERFGPTLSRGDRARFATFFGAGAGAEAARVPARWSPERALAGAPPILAGVAEKDPPSIRAEHAALVAAARAAGVDVDAFTAARVGHMGLVLQLGAPHDEVGPRVVDFVRRVTGASSSASAALRR